MLYQNMSAKCESTSKSTKEKLRTKINLNYSFQ